MHKNSQINGARARQRRETSRAGSLVQPACKMTNAKVYEKENMNILYICMYIFIHIFCMINIAARRLNDNQRNNQKVSVCYSSHPFINNLSNGLY